MKRILAMLLAAVLGGCTANGLDFNLPLDIAGNGKPETRALTGSIGSAKAPLLRQLRSIQVQNLLDGETHRLRISKTSGGIRVREPGGCVWTRSHDWFAPSDSFARCGSSKNWHTAQARVERDGSLFPLRIGNTATYERRAVSWNGNRSTRRTTCVVEDTVEVLRPGKRPIPTFVVACNDGRVTRTTWYAPRQGPIAYREVGRHRHIRDAWLRLD
ncbi:MAG: hypothetical protein AAFP68_01470 [Pseudomonadota bacterium]